MKILRPGDEHRRFLFRNHLLALLWLVVLILAAYSNSFHASWHLDDGPNITENRKIQLKAITWAEIRKTFLSTPSSSGVEFFRPLSRMSLALNYYFGKENVVGYHIINVSVHVVASFFLYLFLFNALNTSRLREKYGKHTLFLALSTALLWAAHPIQTQAVTYIVQRMTCMAGMFYILSMYFYVKAYAATEKYRKRLFVLCCFVSGLLSLASKENAVLLPVSLFLFHLWILRGLSREQGWRSLKLFSVTCVLPIFLAIAFLYFQTDFLGRVFNLYENRVFTPGERLLTEPRVILLYVSLLFYPISTRFSLDHDIEISKSLFSPPSTLPSIVIVIGLIVLAVYLARKSPLVSFSILFFFLNHLVESTFLPLELVFEHRNYVPSMFVFLPVSLGILRLLRFGYARPVVFRSTVAFLGAILLVLGFSTFLRNAAWRDEGTLWSDCLDQYPNSFRAHHNLARFLDAQGREAEALRHYSLALQGKELHSRKEKGITWFNIGLIAHQKGDYGRALSCYSKALELDPCCPGANNNLAGLILDDERSDSAEILRVLEKAIECRNETEIPLALSNQGFLLVRVGRLKEGIEALRKSFDMDPQNPLTLLRLGCGYKKQGDLGAATFYLNHLLDLNPRDIQSLLLLSETLLLSGDPDGGATVLKRLQGIVQRDALEGYFQESARNPGHRDLDPDLSLLYPLLERTFAQDGVLLGLIRSASRTAFE